MANIGSSDQLRRPGLVQSRQESDADRTLRLLPVQSFSRAGHVEHVSALLAEPAHSSLVMLAWRPPAWDDAAEPMPDWDLLAQPEPNIEFDQRVSW
jgi:hypothetical protein